MTAAALADSAVTPAALLARAESARKTADDAEISLLETAVEWAYAHAVDPDPDLPNHLHAHPITGEVAYADPAPGEDEHSGTWFGVPEIEWSAPAAFALAVNLSTQAGAKLIRDALILRHRMPLTWRRVIAREVPAWRARRIADAVAGQPDDVVDYVDEHVHDVAATIGTRTLDRLVDEALLRLHAEDRELDQLAALDARHATLHLETINHTGIAEMTLRADWVDLAAFDSTLGHLAHALDDPELAELAGIAAAAADQTHDVRRALALGVLADPEAAAALLRAARTGDVTERSPRARRQAVLHLHLTDAALLGFETVARAETTGSGIPVLAEQVREWCGRTDHQLTVQPIIDTAEHVAVDAYEIPDRLRRNLLADHTSCVFPRCEHIARSADLDHITPWHTNDPGGGGPTSTSNLAPLCRHHHRLKTHAGWRYQRLDRGLYLWTSPHGRQYLRTPHGTRPVDAPEFSTDRARAVVRRPQVR